MPWLRMEPHEIHVHWEDLNVSETNRVASHEGGHFVMEPFLRSRTQSS